MNGYEIKQALRSGGTVCGTLIVSPSPKWPKYIRQTGIDFVFIDTEHVLIDSTTLSWMCVTYGALGLAPIVRLPSADPARATAVLDGGAQGVLVPYMESVEVLRQMAGAVHKKPLKGEKLAGELSGRAPFPDRLRARLAESNRNNLLFVNIESIPALSRLDELLSVEGLDGVVVGPNDLSYSMDRPNEYDDPEFEAALCEILARARARGVAAGVHALGDISRQIGWAKKTGMNMLWHSGDVYAFVSGMKRDIAAYRQALSPGQARPDAEDAAHAVKMEI